jgi:rod shape determining protein RodA
VAAVFFFHIVINVCMTIGLAPVIGIPLPFISYGGTSLLTISVMLFILIRLDADRQMVLR